ncbi:MAG: CDP-glucose 4,6-dehydratase [Labilithrix sp.]
MRAHYAGKRVLVTGHTGFKGGWLSLWLNALGARVHGYALDPNTTPSLFELARVGKVVDDARGDIRDLDKVVARVAAVKPDYLFHMAAQPIVRTSYDEPAYTFDTNVMGTVNVLEAVRRWGGPCSTVIITTDKVYEDTNGYACRETDPLGSADPYSASKACAEIVTSSYARSYKQLKIASARAGNVIGGGDYAVDRLLPDIVRSILKNEPLTLRHPGAVRPWQHVMEPLSGYLLLGAKLADGEDVAEGWNFGPSSDSFRTVMEIATQAAKILATKGEAPLPIQVGAADPNRHEMPSLTLATDKARRRLGWRPVWGIDRAVDETMEWYRAVRAGKDAAEATLAQIAAYEKDANV